jgi:hypothetical protein
VGLVAGGVRHRLFIQFDIMSDDGKEVDSDAVNIDVNHHKITAEEYEKFRSDRMNDPAFWTSQNPNGPMFMTWLEDQGVELDERRQQMLLQQLFPLKKNERMHVKFVTPQDIDINVYTIIPSPC